MLCYISDETKDYIMNWKWFQTSRGLEYSRSIQKARIEASVMCYLLTCYLSVWLPVYSSIYPSIHPSIHPSLHPSFSLWLSSCAYICIHRLSLAQNDPSHIGFHVQSPCHWGPPFAMQILRTYAFKIKEKNKLQNDHSYRWLGRGFFFSFKF